MHLADEHMLAAACHAARLLEVLGAAAAVPDAPVCTTWRVSRSRGGGWISGPSSLVTS